MIGHNVCSTSTKDLYSSGGYPLKSIFEKYASAAYNN